MEIFDDFRCFGCVRSGGGTCSRSFTQVNVLSVGRELDLSNLDSGSWWCPCTPWAHSPLPKQPVHPIEKCRRGDKVLWRSRRYERGGC